MSEPAITPHRRLLDLPNEILRNIMDMVADDHNGKGLEKFRQTCQQATLLADPVWLRNIQLENEFQCKKLDVVLKAAEHRKHYVEEMEIYLDADDSWEEDEAIRMLGFISRLPRLKRLAVRYNEGYDEEGMAELCTDFWGDTLNDELQNSHFAELEEFTIELTIQGSYSLSLVPLLGAPKLRRLDLHNLNLTQLQLDEIPSSSTCLTRLKFWTCVFDKESMRSILSKPRKLESLTLDGLWHERNNPKGYSGMKPHDEVTTLQEMLQIIAQEQPELENLTSTLHYPSTLRGQWKDEIRFDQLQNLKNLNIRAIENKKGEPLWRPVHALYDLPASIEHIKLTMVCGGLDFAGLVDALLDPKETAASLPTSLCHLEIDTGEKSEDWDNKDSMDRDLRENIGRLMAGSALPKLIYRQTHCRPVHLRDGQIRSRHWIRELTALRKVAIDRKSVSKLDEPYSLTEKTSAEDCPDQSMEFVDLCR
ncbi:hypothetical protein H2200_006962 [Cladophialophora chaetospira]|uniref:F-box domain-containing protein n=1 Tax=Cladophialophora chaetospira TaxID=386627 RepID=A0AA38X9B6_9EURO|nr:hypothetical protein H2200_006962 [Cladophialophora chaetospira]